MQRHRPRLARGTIQKVALLPWGDLIEDWLDTLGVSFTEFRTEMTGSWIFGFADALRQEGLTPGLICFSRSVVRPLRTTHEPTGTTLHVLPPSRALRLSRGPQAERTGARPTGRAATVRWGAERLVATPMLPLARLMRRDFDALLCHEYESPRFDVCVLAGRLVRIPVFGVFQGHSSPLTEVERVWRGTSIRASAGLIIGSARECERVGRQYRLPDGRIGRIFNPVDLSFWQPINREHARTETGTSTRAEVAVWHGPIVFGTKGLDILVEAWSRVSRARPRRELELILLGTGVDRLRLRELVAAHGLRNVRHIDEFVLDRERIRMYLSAADLYVFPSRREGFPVAPLEAMACGLPVIAATVSGIPEIFPAGEHSGGLLVPSNAPDALVAALGRLLDDRALRTILGRRARARVTSAFSPAEIGRQLRVFLEQRT